MLFTWSTRIGPKWPAWSVFPYLTVILGLDYTHTVNDKHITVYSIFNGRFSLVSGVDEISNFDLVKDYNRYSTFREIIYMQFVSLSRLGIRRKG